MCYKEITVEGKKKNCFSVHCQNIEGYLMHELILARIDNKLVDPFTLCDAIYIRKSLATEENLKYIDRVANEEYRNLIENIKHNSFVFMDSEDERIYKNLINNIK